MTSWRQRASGPGGRQWGRLCGGTQTQGLGDRPRCGPPQPRSQLTRGWAKAEISWGRGSGVEGLWLSPRPHGSGGLGPQGVPSVPAGGWGRCPSQLTSNPVGSAQRVHPKKPSHTARGMGSARPWEPEELASSVAVPTGSSLGTGHLGSGRALPLLGDPAWAQIPPGTQFPPPRHRRRASRVPWDGDGAGAGTPLPWAGTSPPGAQA